MTYTGWCCFEPQLPLPFTDLTFITHLHPSPSSLTSHHSPLTRHRRRSKSSKPTDRPLGPLGAPDTNGDEAWGEGDLDSGQHFPQYTATTSYYVVLLPIISCVSCSRPGALNTRSSTPPADSRHLPPSPAVYNPSKFTPQPLSSGSEGSTRQFRFSCVCGRSFKQGAGIAAHQRSTLCTGLPPTAASSAPSSSTHVS